MTEHRVLHFLWSGGIGGSERSIYQLMRLSLLSGRADAGVAFGQAKGPYCEAIRAMGREVIDLRMRGAVDLPRALAATSDLRRFDIHHFHVLEPSQMLASIRCKETVRVFTERRGAYSTTDSVALKVRRLTAGVLLRRYFHGLSGNTAYATEYATEQYRLEHLDPLVTYNGLDLSILEPRRERTAARQEIRAATEDIVIGSSGRFEPLKRLDRVVRLLGSFGSWRVLLLGDGELRAALEMQARALGASERLHIAGYVENVADYLIAVDIFVMPSGADESFGNSLVEAMALGVPSIVFTDSPGLCEHIVDGVTGFVVADQDGLEAVVARLQADPVLRMQVGEAAARSIRSKYTLENMSEAYERLYESALTCKR